MWGRTGQLTLTWLAACITHHIHHLLLLISLHQHGQYLLPLCIADGAIGQCSFMKPKAFQVKRLACASMQMKQVPARDNWPYASGWKGKARDMQALCILRKDTSQSIPADQRCSDLPGERCQRALLRLQAPSSEQQQRLGPYPRHQSTCSTPHQSY